jgi:hypothetical protein
MKERRQNVEIRTGQKPKKETPLKTRVNPCPRCHQERKIKTEDRRLEKAFELLTAGPIQAMNDECRHFGNMIAAKVRT